MPYTEKLVIDVTEPGGRNVLFRPLGVKLETEVSVAGLAKLKRKASNFLTMIGGYCPGDRFTIDFKTRKYSIVDKLMLREHKELWENIKAIEASREDFPQKVGPRHETIEGTIVDDPDTIATWLYHIRCLVDCKNFTLVEGKLPPFDDIHAMGNVQRSQGYSLPEKLIEKCCKIPKTTKEPVTK